jgi:hypothetical protein
MRARPATQCQQQGARPVRFAAITGAGERREGGTLFGGCGERRFASYRPQIRAASESEHLPLVNRPESALGTGCDALKEIAGGAAVIAAESLSCSTHHQAIPLWIDDPGRHHARRARHCCHPRRALHSYGPNPRDNISTAALDSLEGIGETL